jgi:hypothetical protein
MRNVSYYFALEIDENDAALRNIGKCHISIINATHLIFLVITLVTICFFPVAIEMEDIRV